MGPSMAAIAPSEMPRGVAVFYVWSTGKMLLLFDNDLNLLAEKSTLSMQRSGPP